MIKSYDSFIENSKFSVLTDNGFRKFDGITRTRTDEPLIKLTLNNGDVIKCTFNHRIYTTAKDKQFAQFLEVGDTLYTAYNKVRIVSIDEVYEPYVYDLINVHIENSYLINASKVLSSNCLYLDEFAFVENDVDFYTSTYPTVTSGKSTKVIITSTPNGMNLFYKIFNDSQNGENNYKSYKIGWWEHPERDDAWRDETLGNIGESQFSVEYLCQFMGSAGTLISGKTLELLTYSKPLRENISSNKTIRVFKEPIENHKYVTIVDTGEGVGLDYSVISVVDVTSTPYEQVFMYKDNTTSPTILSTIVNDVATKYNKSVLLVENNNTSGGIVTNELWFNIEYDNMLTSKKPTNDNKEDDVEIGFGYKSIAGIRTTKKTKAVGCTHLKNLVESGQLKIVDFDTQSELTTFIRVGNSYAAEKNKHDDIVMTMVMFAWFTAQEYFEDSTGINTKDIVNSHLIGDDMDFVLGFISDGTDYED